MIRIEVVVTPDEAAVVWAAIEREARGGEAKTFDRADGLVTIAREALEATSPDVPALGYCADGTCVSAETSRRLACDAGVVELIEDANGQPLSVGRRTRTIPAAIKRALLRRDGHCRFPGCTNRVFLDGHHLRHWVNGGPTRLDNLCSICRHHHAYVHEHGYRVEHRDGELIFFDPRGRIVEHEPRRLPATTPMSTERAWSTLTAEHQALAIDADTGRSGWDGRPAQYAWIVDGLWRLETASPSPR